jgi:hypothetical protein
VAGYYVSRKEPLGSIKYRELHKPAEEPLGSLEGLCSIESVNGHRKCKFKLSQYFQIPVF